MKSHQRGLTLVAFLLFSSLLLQTKAHGVAASPLDITDIQPSSFTLVVGGPAKQVTITTSEAIASSDAVSWTDLGGVVEVVKTDVSGNTAVTTLRALKFSPTPKEIKVSVAGSEPKTVTVTTETFVTAANLPQTPDSEMRIKQDVPLSILLVNPPSAIPDEGLQVRSGDESFVSADLRDNKASIRIIGIKPTPATGPIRVTVTSNGQIIKTYDVTVEEALDHVEAQVNTITLTEGQPYSLSKLGVEVKGKSNGDLTTSTEFKPQFDTTSVLATIDPAGTTLTAVRAPVGNEEPPKLLVRVKGETKLTIPIRILPAVSTINLATHANVVFVGKSEVFSVEVLDSQGNRMSNAQIDWTVDPEDESALAIMNARDTQVTVQGLAPKEGVKLIATLQTPPGTTSPIQPKTFFINVKSANVTGFAPLQIRIDLLDSQTAKDLFGKKAADEFYISKIRLFNKLKNQNGEYGDSILVYSESLEVRVQLEMKDKKGGGDWEPVNEGTAANQFTGLFGQPEPFPQEVRGTPNCTDNPQHNFVARYRPYTFDIVANTHDRRDERSTRARILQLANGLSSFASFVTTVAVPASSNDTRLGLDQFKGLLVPSFEKLFPSLKEVQRQNIITMVMRPLEEIPFGSDISRILFIPKGRLYGMLPGKVFRIGGVSTLGACAEVGIVKKAGSSL